MQIVRQKAFSYVITEPLPVRRGFYFKLAAGFQKEVEPHSGMTVNLTDVDSWLNSFIQKIPENGFAVSESHPEQILLQAREFLQFCAHGRKAKLVSLSLSEERNWSLNWNESLPAGHFLFECSHFFESFHADCKPLLRIFFQWQVSSMKAYDYPYESLKLLKSCGLDSCASMEANIDKLADLCKAELGSTSFLQKIAIENKAGGYVFHCHAKIHP